VSIHSTAIIDPGAELGADVSVGPYAIVGPKVTLGDGTSVGAHAIVESHVRAGRNCRISPHASIGAPPQDLKFKGEDTWVEIGDGTTVREFATVNRGTVGGGGVTRVGAGAFLMAYTHVAHDCVVGDRVIMANAATLAGHVTIEEGAIIGGIVAIHQFARIGAYAIVSGLSGVSQDVPPYVTAAPQRRTRDRSLFGLNLIGLRRNGFDEPTIDTLRQAYRILFQSSIPMREAVAKAEAEVPTNPAVAHLLEFVRSSRRGVLR
jgi:UDP-N-acetylglucosamine acyltransferase